MARATLSLSEALRTEAIVYAREALPEEACGFLLGSEAAPDAFRVEAITAARNLHPNREDRFLIDPLEYAKAERRCARHAGWRVLGFWHSHPASPPRPSPIDLEQAQGLHASFPARYVYVIVSLEVPDAPALAAWRLDAHAAAFEALGLR